MNIRDYLGQTHPDLGVATRPGALDEIYRAIWGHPYPGYHGPPAEALSRSVLRWSANAAARESGAGGGVGLVICTWNRPQYLESCLSSVSASDLTGVVTVVVDDASGDAATLELIQEFELKTPLLKVYKNSRRQIHHSLDLGWSLLSGLGCRYLTNLDADAVVARNWIGMMKALYDREVRSYGNIIVTGFNRAGDPDIVAEREDCRIRMRAGGINYFFGTHLFAELRPFLFDTTWDMIVQAHIESRFGAGYRLISTRPSYVQHIGRVGMNSNPRSTFDVADDFVGVATVDLEE